MGQAIVCLECSNLLIEDNGNDSFRLSLWEATERCYIDESSDYHLKQITKGSNITLAGMYDFKVTVVLLESQI